MSDDIMPSANLPHTAMSKLVPKLGTKLRHAAIVLAYFCTANYVAAHGNEPINIPKQTNAQALDQITVLGRRENIVGTAVSASQGEISAAQIQSRAITRAGDLAEFVPGLIATQHSGNGKANQYFLRGFNLDHATVRATAI